jgi:hypothetical protein
MMTDPEEGDRAFSHTTEQRRIQASTPVFATDASGSLASSLGKSPITAESALGQQRSLG